MMNSNEGTHEWMGHLCAQGMSARYVSRDDLRWLHREYIGFEYPTNLRKAPLSNPHSVPTAKTYWSSRRDRNDKQGISCTELSMMVDCMHASCIMLRQSVRGWRGRQDLVFIPWVSGNILPEMMFEKRAYRSLDFPEPLVNALRNTLIFFKDQQRND